jgi:Asp-tRNA(Asn)/Glu-tRNA(Gln) amidotransferase B subunit
MDIVEPGHPSWCYKDDIEWYVWKCKDKGFVRNKQDVHNVINRWLSGKRKITPPGTRKAKKLMQQKKKGVPSEVKEIIASVIAKNQVLADNYKAGQEKALNVLVGKALKEVSHPPAIIKEYIIGVLND